jgi:hypothetical protein
VVCAGFVGGLATLVWALELLPNPSGREIQGHVEIVLERPPEGFERTVQVQSSCGGHAFRTFTVSPVVWTRTPGDHLEQLAFTDGECTLDARLLPGQAPWVRVQISEGSCSVQVHPTLELRC